MSTKSDSDAVFAESTGGVAVANVGVISGNSYQVTVREVTGSGSVAFTVQTLVGGADEELYESDGATQVEMTLGSEYTFYIDTKCKSITATSTDSPLPSFTLAVAKR